MIAVRAMHVAQLLRSTEVKSERDIPRLDIDGNEGEAEDIARKVRQYWGLPRGPVPDLVDAIERAGAIVIPCDFGVSEIDAIGFS